MKKTRRFAVDPWGAVVSLHSAPPKRLDVDKTCMGLAWADADNPLRLHVWINPALSRLPRGLFEREYRRFVVHESTHLAQLLAEAVETKFDDETQAYLVSWIVDKIYELSRRPLKRP